MTKLIDERIATFRRKYFLLDSAHPGNILLEMDDLKAEIEWLKANPPSHIRSGGTNFIAIHIRSYQEALDTLLRYLEVK